MDLTANTDYVRAAKAGSVGHIVLNRPDALNSLNLAMVRQIDASLDSFEKDASVLAVVISGAGDRAFCAGGDIRFLYDSLPARPQAALVFWREEYRLNARIAQYTKPFVAVMDRITMGGGIGLSAHGRYRIVTERTRIAMPEVGIGFFPDVGGTWLLSRAAECGTYLGLTGRQIGAADAIDARLADVCVAAADLPALVAALESGERDPATVVRAFARAPGSGILAEHRHEITGAFSLQTIEAIVAELDAIGTDFARATRATLLAKSPTSLKLTLHLLQEARQSPDLRTCLEREFAACHRIVANPDLKEGIRAAIVDKDRKPHWCPSTIAEVSGREIESYFVPAPAPLFAQR